MQVLPAGPDALLAEVADAAHVPLLYADLRRELRCRDVVPGARTVLLDGLDDLDAARSYLVSWTPSRTADRVQAGLVELPTTYDGQDHDEVAQRWAMTRRE